MASDVAHYKTLLAQQLRALQPYPAAQFAGFGIVVCAGGPLFFTNAYVLVHVLRQSLGCQLPIEVWYLGAREMSPRMLSLLRELGVRTVDANEKLSSRELTIEDGWQLKSFAAMWSGFEDLLLLDADQVPTRDPAELVDWPEYRSAGAVLWPDIVDLVSENPVWEACGLEPQTRTAIESGQLLINKARHWKALQAAFHLNQHAEFYYRMIYGDKDTFLLGLLLTESPLALIPHRPMTDRGLCLYQRDFKGEVLFQHRTGAKWRYSGRQDSLPGFVGEDACLMALEVLRRDWNGLIFHPPQSSPQARVVEEDLCAQGPLLFLVAGEAPIRLELLRDGEIGEGRAPSRMNWRCEERARTMHLVIHDAFAPCWKLAQQANGHWHGYSIGDPETQVYVAFERCGVDALGEKEAANVRGSWPMPGRYSSPDEDVL